MINGIGKHVAFGDWFIFRSEVCAPKAPPGRGARQYLVPFYGRRKPQCLDAPRLVDSSTSGHVGGPPGSRCARARASVFGHPFSALSGLDLGAGSPGVARPTTVPLDAPRTDQSASPSGRAFHGPASSALGLRVLHARAKTYFPLFFFVCFVFHFQPD